MNKQIAVSIKDLRYATILCRTCNTRVTLDLAMEFPPNGHMPFSTPKECPRCDARFDSVIPGAIDNMQKVYQALAEIGDAVTFTVGEADY